MVCMGMSCNKVVNFLVAEIIDIFGNAFAVHILACINQHTLLVRQFNKYAVALSDIKVMNRECSVCGSCCFALSIGTVRADID